MFQVLKNIRKRGVSGFKKHKKRDGLCLKQRKRKKQNGTYDDEKKG